MKEQVTPNVSSAGMALEPVEIIPAPPSLAAATPKSRQPKAPKNVEPNYKKELAELKVQYEMMEKQNVKLMQDLRESQELYGRLQRRIQSIAETISASAHIIKNQAAQL